MKHTLGKDCLYLVTDSDLLYKGAASLEAHVESAIRGGVDVVQLREKHADTGDFIEKGRRLLEVCRRHKVPLIVNDRVDVALAIGADGVHIGQDDMECVKVREMMGPDCIIGVSVNTIEETIQAVKDGADYVGIGAVYDTSTKKLVKPTLGTSGVQEILQYLSTVERQVGSVAIGGVNASNIDRIMFASSTGSKTLSGIALVSAIMTSSEPEKVARGLKGLMTSTPPYQQLQSLTIKRSSDVEQISQLVQNIRAKSPLIQQMTNNVVKNFSANVTIAVGASPAMSEAAEEAEDFARMNGALLVNMGTMSSSDSRIYAVQQNNRFGKPTVLDPVGAGATAFRRSATKQLLDHCYFDVLKGNESEIRAASGLAAQQKGVDNVTTSDTPSRCRLAAELARKLHNVVVISGVEDVVSDGTHTAVVRCGHALLADVTGTGCSLGSVIASSLAVNTGDKFSAVIAAVALYGLAAEHAAEKDWVEGPGTFVPAFIDSLYALTKDEASFSAALTAKQNLLEMI